MTIPKTLDSTLPEDLNSRIDLALKDYRLGDYLGASWEGNGTDWTETDWETICRCYKVGTSGTDESDIVD